MAKKLLQVLTNSELECWRSCPAKHGYAYRELLRPKVDSLPRAAGRVLHTGIEVGWRAAWSEADVSLDTRLERAVSAGRRGVFAACAEAVRELERMGYEGTAAEE
jgi:hypothetical protein